MSHPILVPDIAIEIDLEEINYKNFYFCLIRESLNNIQGVIDPQVKVVPRQNGIIIDIFSKLITGINVTDKTKEIRETASDFKARDRLARSRFDMSC